MVLLRFIQRPLSVSVIFLFILVGCGGSENSNETPLGTAEPVVLTGIFVDSAVQGLTYSTDTQSGLTNEAGEFSYIQGESITFSIGDIQFPSVFASDIISPLDIFSVTEISDLRVLNMARFLQSLDQDGLPGNGITITDDVHNQAVGVTVDFSAVDFTSQVEDIIANAGGRNTVLVSAQAASDHLSLTLGNMSSPRSCPSSSEKIGYTGTFSTLAHNVSGRATVIDDCRLEITLFNFDGAAPNVRFYAGVNGNFSDSSAFGIGERIDGRSYVNETLILVLPEGKFVDDFDSLSVWCVEFSADFGNLRLQSP